MGEMAHLNWACSCGYIGDDTLDHCPECDWVGRGPTIDGAVAGDCPECGNPLSDYNACPECQATVCSGFGPATDNDRLRARVARLEADKAKLIETCQEALEQVGLLAKNPETNWLYKQLRATLNAVKGDDDG